MDVYVVFPQVRESKLRFEAQRTEYEAAISRHQAFIDQLIEDKKSISQKCEQLSTDFRSAERRNKENVKVLSSDIDNAAFLQMEWLNCGRDHHYCLR